MSLKLGEAMYDGCDFESMSIGPLKRRSSWPSSFVTGLIGWNGFFIIIGAILGMASRAGDLFVLATIAAVCQVLFLRLLFFPLRLDRGMSNGAFWGGVSGIILVVLEKQFTTLFASHPIVWLLNGAYIGIAVGLFLCYFYRDDRQIESLAKQRGREVDYGRDAHWLEPFFFGVVAYLIAFLPTSLSLAVNLAVVGAMSGVVAAGVSHFFLFTVARKSVVPFLLSIVAGIVQGMLTGLLFRSFAAGLFFSPLVHGAVAGCLTYLMTSFRGRALAGQESAGDTA
jgi:hypothetical protein